MIANLFFDKEIVYSPKGIYIIGPRTQVFSLFISILESFDVLAYFP